VSAVENLFGDLGINGRIILKCILEKYGVKVWTGLSGIWISSNSGLLRTNLQIP
jgi:hypothetical protein